ncbi:Txe/YoeB family addiction module toxin [Pseudohongiella sp. SYSU M77423]|uniref:Txe/YoeB family addiction module toxin n=1 Tax=unclassified Pseudohongiella TaxID=2629611 RepID=UPI001F02B964|nr:MULTISPECIES: Txe/YoeB family addiction module toxin [unclassified Pseudohongiella]MDH7943453.1 Txe/YoeB family addiction module toxin [Pseudohongiella sp. SYSU M77423]MEC8860045.1 Txe/YoeB family addiction module toxin [Pseudomonadota bacterium]
MRSLVFEGKTWEAYEAMRQNDKKLHDAARKMIKELIRCEDPAVGTGKPEPLKHNLTGLWSRRISQKDRIVYRFDESSIYIFALGGHYDEP